MHHNATTVMHFLSIFQNSFLPAHSCQNGCVTEINRREFLKKLGMGATGIALGGVALSLNACAKDDKKDSSAKSIDTIRVSSDLYKSELPQRLAFALFMGTELQHSETLKVKLTKPDGSVSVIDNVRPRVEGLKNQGLYSLEYEFINAGNYEISTTYKGSKTSLAFAVAETNVVPGLETQCLSTISPTNADPKDAKILCTRFEGECGLHEYTVSDLLAKKEPLIVMFATPARCQTSYCGPVLDLLKNEIKTNPINAVHIEIYKDETSPNTLDAVNEWTLPSEPWLFAVNKDGKIVKRLDGAFDLSEIKEAIAAARV